MVKPSPGDHRRLGEVDLDVVRRHGAGADRRAPGRARPAAAGAAPRCARSPRSYAPSTEALNSWSDRASTSWSERPFWRRIARRRSPMCRPSNCSNTSPALLGDAVPWLGAITQGARYQIVTRSHHSLRSSKLTVLGLQPLPHQCRGDRDRRGLGAEHERPDRETGRRRTRRARRGRTRPRARPRPAIRRRPATRQRVGPVAARCRDHQTGMRDEFGRRDRAVDIGSGPADTARRPPARPARRRSIAAAASRVVPPHDRPRRQAPARCGRRRAR